MKESVAKEKWCPFARLYRAQGQFGAAAVNRFVDWDGDKSKTVEYNTRCIGNECMAWIREPMENSITYGHCGLVNPTQKVF